MRLLLLFGAGLAFVFACQQSSWEQAAALIFASAGLLMVWAVFTPDADDEWFEDPTEDRRDPK